MDVREYNKLLEKLGRIEDKVLKAKSLNGGFDTLLSEVEHVKHAQTEILDSIRAVKRSLYEPDSGLYSRVQVLELESVRRMEYITETKPMITEHQELIIWRKQAERELEDYEAFRVEMADLRSWKSGVSKAIWFLAFAAGGIWVKQLLEVVTNG
jgi:hypothetical protein